MPQNCFADGFVVAETREASCRSGGRRSGRPHADGSGLPREYLGSVINPSLRHPLPRGQCWKPTYEAVFASRRTTMRRFRKFTFTRIMLLAIGFSLPVGFSLPASDELAQGSKELVGAWTLVSITVNQGGQKKIEPFGPAPKGSLIFEPNARFSITVTRSDLSKLGSATRLAGTTAENSQIVQGRMT